MIYTRKDFLKKSAVMAAALMSTGIRSQDNNGKSAVIVGGGLSGLTSAYSLKKQGFSVTVLEAGARLGGRVLTYYGDGVNAELGGEWISSGHSDILSLIDELGLKTTEFALSPDLLEYSSYRQSGSWDLLPESKEILSKLTRIYEKMPARQKKGMDQISFFHYLRYQGINRKDLKLLDLVLKSHYGESIRRLSAEAVIGDYARKSDRYGINVKIAGGNFGLITRLAKKIGKENILLSEEVRSVKQQDKVIVTTASGREVTADFCVVTVPATVLEEIRWEPELPREKKLALLKMQYARKGKYIYFTKAANPGKEKLDIIAEGPFNRIYNSTQDNQSKVFTLISSGDVSELLAGDKDLAGNMLESSLKKAGINILDGRHVNYSFQNDPFIKGSNSVYTAGSWGIRDMLSKPVKNIYFAGEHLAEVNGTMNSAVSSGAAVAREIGSRTEKSLSFWPLLSQDTGLHS